MERVQGQTRWRNIKIYNAGIIHSVDDTCRPSVCRRIWTAWNKRACHHRRQLAWYPKHNKLCYPLRWGRLQLIDMALQSYSIEVVPPSQVRASATYLCYILFYWVKLSYPLRWGRLQLLMILQESLIWSCPTLSNEGVCNQSHVGWNF